MKISILTLFPEMFKGPFDYSILKNARERKLVTIEFINIRDFGIGKHKVVDDKPYGGGKGMILRVDVLEHAITSIKDKNPPAGGQRVVLLDPRGKTFNQKSAKQLAKLKHLILVCGHYEGVDERIRKFVDEEISVGDFVLTGGEIPAMLITDAVLRLQEGILEKEVIKKESFSTPFGPLRREASRQPYLEWSQYTRPQIYKNLKVPKILLSGNHKKIEEWRKESAKIITRKFRPDFLINPKRDPKSH